MREKACANQTSAWYTPGITQNGALNLISGYKIKFAIQYEINEFMSTNNWLFTFSMEPFDLDLLQEGGWSDVLCSLKRYAPQGYKFALTRTPQQIKLDVLNSRRVQHVIEKVIYQTNIVNIYQGFHFWPVAM